MNVYWDDLWARGHDANMGSGAANAYWGDTERAKYYDSEVCKDDWSKGRHQMESIPHTASDTVLDIGAGPGSLAIPLSREVAQVTAVEPSPAMNWCANQHIRRLGIRSISIIEKAWENVTPIENLQPPYDVVVCSFSLGMRDIRPALQKMQDVCCGTVHLFWHLGNRFPERELHTALAARNIPFEPIPKANILYNILSDMGIYPNIDVSCRAVRQEYPSLRAACEVYEGKHRLDTPEERRVLRNIVSEALTVNGAGQYELQTTWHSAHIWWRP